MSQFERYLLALRAPSMKRAWSGFRVRVTHHPGDIAGGLQRIGLRGRWCTIRVMDVERQPKAPSSNPLRYQYAEVVLSALAPVTDLVAGGWLT